MKNHCKANPCCGDPYECSMPPQSPSGLHSAAKSPVKREDCDHAFNTDEFRKLVDEGRAFADTNREESFIADAELSCPHCGGSGHKDDVISPTTETKGPDHG